MSKLEIIKIKKLINGFKVKYNSNVKINIKSKNSTIICNINEYLFEQIVVSMILNFMFFNKNAKANRDINIILSKDHLSIRSNAFTFNKLQLSKYSQIIFSNTGNPYQLNFGQIFKQCDMNGINYLVHNVADDTYLELKLFRKEIHDPKILQFKKGSGI